MSKKVLNGKEIASVKGGMPFALREGDDFGGFNPRVTVIASCETISTASFNNAIIVCHAGDPGVFVTTCGCEDNKDV